MWIESNPQKDLEVETYPTNVETNYTFWHLFFGAIINNSNVMMTLGVDLTLWNSPR
jgi:hypothetical protein